MYIVVALQAQGVTRVETIKRAETSRQAAGKTGFSFSFSPPMALSPCLLLHLLFLYVVGRICGAAALVIVGIHVLGEGIVANNILNQLDYDREVRRALVRSRMDHFELTNEGVMKAIERIPGVTDIRLDTDYAVKSIVIYIHRRVDGRRMLAAVKPLSVSIKPPMWIHFRRQ